MAAWQYTWKYQSLETAVQPLINALNDGDSDVRRNAAEALGNIKSDTAVQPLINALKDERLNVRGSAAEALRKIFVLSKIKSS